MKKILFFTVFLTSFFVQAQTDFSDRWEDFFSYNNVKDFTVTPTTIYAISDNAVFTYDKATGAVEKMSSVQGLSGEKTSAIHYNETYGRLVIGYENGLIEVVDADGNIAISADIVSFNQSGGKRINHIYEHENTLYLSTPFAVVEYDIERLEFGDTFFIGAGSTAVKINQTAVRDNLLCAATENGIYFAEVSNPYLIDYTQWTHRFTGAFSQITLFNNRLYTTQGNTLHHISPSQTLQLTRTFTNPIVAVKSTETTLNISSNTIGYVLDTNEQEVAFFQADSAFDFTINTLYSEENTVFIGTQQFGILKASFSDPQNFEEIHPAGPLSNQVFSLTAANQHLWIVYGGYNDTYSPTLTQQGFTHYNGELWVNTLFDPSFPVTDLVQVTIDPTHENRVYISSFGDTNEPSSVATGGLLVVENDVRSHFFNHTNSGLEDLLASDPSRVTLRISGTVFDPQGNLWVTNIGVDHKLKKKTPSGAWSGYDLSSLFTNNAYGMNEIVVDKTNSLWIGTRRNGAYVYNETGDRKRAFSTSSTQGSLPNLNVRTIAVDRNNRVWLGTLSGLVLFTNAAGIFEATTFYAKPVIIDDEGIPKKLLGDQTINSIAIDGADNKWFGTENGGVLYTNPSGQTTLGNYNAYNSPLPSNKILKISVDTSTGKVFIATANGVVAYHSKVAPFGTVLGEVYAYPNPALAHQQTVVIDGRNGTHLPKGTNVKILDTAGRLVYETNVVEGQQVQGGKVVWNKTNLAGEKVASGVYIVLLSTEDGSESSSTKIAIVN